MKEPPAKIFTERFLLFACTLGSIIAVYWPALTPNYAFADDYFCLWNRLYQQNWLYQIITEGILQARPLNGALVAALLSGCTKLANYASFHALTIIQTAILAYLTCLLLNRSGWSRVQSFFIALSLCSLPPLQIINCWAVVTFFVLSAILALLSIFLISSATNDSLPKLKLPKTIFAFILFLLAITIYQPCAMFYWLAVAIVFFNHSLSDKWRYSFLGKAMSVFSIAAISDFLILRIALKCLRNIPVSQARSHLANDFGQKISWFITGPLVDSLNFNHLQVSNVLAFCTGLFILSGLYLNFHTENKTTTVFNLLIAMAFIPLSYLPNLLISENFYTYRTEMGLMALLLFYAYVSLFSFLLLLKKINTQKMATALIVITSILNLFYAHKHVIEFFVRPQLYELNNLKAQLSGKYGKEKQLHPVFLERSDTIAPFNRHDEFGMPSFACPWIRIPGTIILKSEIAEELL